ncbi:hypothetical protein, partial [Rhizobium leguminosarum]|uniref:hypothetical protein n=1 Tax=Rhizobium leguminosarum TaxID=384 RepID=UPI001AEBFD32
DKTNAPNSRSKHKPAFANPLGFLQNERLRRQQRRRPRSVSGLIELTPFPSQHTKQKFFDNFVTG